MLPLVLEDRFESWPGTVVCEPFVLIVEIFHLRIVVVNCGFWRLPDEESGTVVEARVIGIGRQSGVAGDAPVVASHEARCKKQEDARGQDYQEKRGAARGRVPAFLPKPKQGGNRNGNAEKNTFIGAAVEQDGDAQAERDAHCE